MAVLFSDGEYRPSVSVLSMHSLAEHSEPISETEEIESVRRLLKEGNKAFKKKMYEKAISCYSEALEIDDDNTQMLTCRAGAYLETNQYDLAKKDADHVIKINANIPQAYYLQGISFDHLDNPTRAIKSFLKALQLDQDHEQQLTDNIIVVAANLCTLPEDFLENLDEMTVTEQLLFVGRQLHQSNEYRISIDVLLVANSRSSNAKHKLSSLYYIGQGYQGIKNSLQAMEYLQKCLVLCLQEKNQEFEAACYYNLGQIYYDQGYIQEFLVNFEKLLSIFDDLEGTEKSALELKLHESSNIMNIYEKVCCAYSGMGEYDRALVHAKAFVNAALNESDPVRIQQAQFLVADLYFKRMSYTLALKHYEAYMATSKKLNDRAGMAAAYGCIGIVYKTLCNYKLAESYLEQQCHIAEKLKDNKSQCTAFLHLGEIAEKNGKYDIALKYFQSYLRTSRRLDEFETEVKALLRIGELHNSNNNHQHALYFYEQSLSLAEKIENKLLLSTCKYKVASILVISTKLKDFEKARVLLETCIFEYIALLKMHNTDYIAFPNSFQDAMLKAFDMLQIVLQKLSRQDDSLVFAEMEKSLMLNVYGKPQKTKNNLTFSLPTIKQVNKIIEVQNSTVLYYTVTNDFILIWVLKPGKGCVRTERIKLTNTTTWNNLEKAIYSLHAQENKAIYETEYRALPMKDAETYFLQKKFLGRTKVKRKDIVVEDVTDVQENMKEEKATRILYDLLVYPVLLDLQESVELIVIPDKNLFQVPFDSLEDSNGICVGERYQLTIVPSLKFLEHNNSLQNSSGQFQTESSETSRDATSNPIYLDDCFRVVVPQKVIPFAPFHDTVKVAPKMSEQKCDNPKCVSFGSNYHDVKRIEKDVVHQFEIRKLQQNSEKGSTLITTTWCGKEVPSVKNNAVEEYQQTCGENRSVVIGSPHLPAKVKLHGKNWTPPVDYQTAHIECQNVAEYLGTEAVVAEHASKETVMKKIQNATLIHLALPGCWKTGVLACASNNTSLEDSDGAYPEECYQLNSTDISTLRLRAELVVISGCYGNHHRNIELTLPCAFLAAGVKCVLLLLWATSDVVLHMFWYHFYSAMQKGNYLSKAVEKAKMEIRKDERFSDPVFWAPFVLIGIDQYIDISIIKRDMLDQQLNSIESQTLNTMATDALNYTTPGISKSQFVELKNHLSQLLLYHKQYPDAVPVVRDLLMEWHQLCTQTSHPDFSVRSLPQSAVEAPAAIALLHLVGFHFQARGASITEPYVVWPQWDPSGLIHPALQATEAIIDICENADCAVSLARVLECELTLLSSLLDFLCLTRHAPELQLKKTDHLVTTLWINHLTRIFLVSIGLQEVGKLILFKNTLKNKFLLSACMRCICAVLGKKGNALLNRLDPKYIGLPPPKNLSPPKKNRLPSLNPVVLPGNKMTFTTPWSSQKITPQESEMKIELANNLSGIHTAFNKQVIDAKEMHNKCVKLQANESFTINSKPIERLQVVKVLPGRTPSCERIPVNHEEKLSLLAIQQRRDYAHFVYTSRVDDVKIRRGEAVKQVFLPHVQNR